MSRPAQHFSAGPLAFRFEPETGFVRSIRFHGHEILRGVYPAARDREWATLVPEAAPVDASVSPDCVRLRLSARVVADEMDLAWTAEIEAHASGRLHYRWSGRVGRKSTTNRTGLCVLHPAEAAGAPCVIEHTDGRREAGWFPQAISPHQPFRDIRAITHVVGEGAEIEVRMEGEVFEMEDQRNWTDASFKTYCRPLDRPRPYRLAAGEEIEHAVSVDVRGELRPALNAREEIADAPAPLRLPGIGFTLPGPIPAALRERVRALRPAHVRAETTADELAATLAWARAEAEYLDCALAVPIHGATAMPSPRADFPARCVVQLFDADGNVAAPEVLAAWRHAGHAAIATGTLDHFTELNRGRPAASGAHTLTAFGINAQCHASDDTSILETLSQHGVVARLAHRIGGGRPVVVAPISIGRTADSADARLHTDFAALWLLGSLVRLAAAGGVEHATYFHAHGPAGFLREDAETPVERLLLALAGATCIERLPTAQAGVEAMLVAQPAGRVFLLANFGEEPLELAEPRLPRTMVPPRSLTQLPA